MTEAYTPVDWRGKTLDTVGALSDMILLIYREGYEGEASAFMNAYRAINPHANANVGYLSGYYDRDTASGVKALFGVRHPIFD